MAAFYNGIGHCCEFGLVLSKTVPQMVHRDTGCEIPVETFISINSKKKISQPSQNDHNLNKQKTVRVTHSSTQMWNTKLYH